MRDDDNHTFDQYRDHMQRFEAIVAEWRDGKINLAEKRRRIAAENQAYYKQPVTSRASSEQITAMPRAY
jgi:hypothetical protein